MLPIGLWGGQLDISKAKEYVPAFCCSILQSALELGLTGAYDGLEAVIVPSLCDSLKCMGQNFKAGVPQVRMIQFTYPQMRKLEAGVVFLKDEYGRVLAALEEIAGKKVSNADIAGAIDIFNDNRAALRRFVAAARSHADVITAVARHAVIKSGFFMEKPRHTALVNELVKELETLPEKHAENGVLLSGILAEPDSLLRIIDECGMSVLADDLAQESRQFRYDVPTDGEDALYNLARWWQVFEGCSLAYDPEKKRAGMIIDEVQTHGIKGVIFCIMKFCDPEEYDYPIIKAALDEKAIPSLYFELDQPSDVDAQARTRIQAFSEIL
jgi:benzoyl-CoA reductase/2-hydroxyglutaryl-CoA dehydratase subunit BcrC/BadD/HgdB